VSVKRYPVLLTASELTLVEALLSRAFDLAELIRCSTLPEVDRLRRLRDRFRDATSDGPAQERSPRTGGIVNWEPYEHTRTGWMIELEHGGVSVEVGGRDGRGVPNIYSWQAYTGSSDASGAGDVEHCKRAAVAAYAVLCRLEGKVPDDGDADLAEIVDGSWHPASQKVEGS